MSRALEDRVLAARPLAPALRMVLFVIARQVPEGATDVTVNRTALARDLQARADLVRAALVAGEAIGLCRVLPNRVSFSTDGLFEPAPVAPSKPAVVAATGEAPHAPPTLKAFDVLTLFAGLRKEHGYVERFVFEQRYYKMAKDHGLTTLTVEELRRRMAAFYTDDDPFYAKCGHAFSVFCKNVNRFVRRRHSDSRDTSRTAVPGAAETEAMLRRVRGGQ